jgi:DNA-binding beta-propeller fold protein YncE
MMIRRNQITRFALIATATAAATIATGPATPSNGPVPPSRRTVLPFTDLTYPDSMAADPAGNVYVADGRGNRVLKLAAGTNDRAVLPFTGLGSPGGVAVDAAGNVYVLDNSGFGRVVKLAAG